MVQGGLLTAHPGGVHGYGGSPGGVISRRQGAGAASSGAPDLKNGGGGGTEGFPRKRVLAPGFLPRGQYIGEGGPRGAT